MNLILMGAFALSFQSSPADLGYDLFQLGACEEAGWALDRAGIAPLVIGRVSTSGLSDADFEAGMTEGATRAGAEFEATTLAIATRVQARAFRDTVAQRCDALTTAYPDIISRTPETGATWNARMESVIARYPE